MLLSDRRTDGCGVGLKRKLGRLTFKQAPGLMAMRGKISKIMLWVIGPRDREDIKPNVSLLDHNKCITNNDLQCFCLQSFPLKLS